MYFKGLVLEVKENFILVMKDNGVVVKLKGKRGVKIGEKIIFLEEDIIQVKGKKIKNYFMPIVAAASFVLVFILMVFNGKGEATKAYAMVTFDVNPSIAIELDKNEKIIDIHGLNDDGVALNLSDLKGKTLEEGAKVFKEKIVESSTIQNKDSLIVGFTFMDNIEDTNYEDKIKNVLKESFNDFKIMYLKGSKDKLDEAISKGMSLGRYEAILALGEDELEDSLEGLSVPELMELLNKYSNIPNLNKDILEEIQDELEDKMEDEKEDDDKDEDEDKEDDDKDDDKEEESNIKDGEEVEDDEEDKSNSKVEAQEIDSNDEEDEDLD